MSEEKKVEATAAPSAKLIGSLVDPPEAKVLISPFVHLLTIIFMVVEARQKEGKRCELINASLSWVGGLVGTQWYPALHAPAIRVELVLSPYSIE